MSEIVDTIKMERLAKATGWGTLIKTPGNRKRLFIAVSLGAMAQWNGAYTAPRVFCRNITDIVLFCVQVSESCLIT